MSAEMLRRAAALMRERAQYADAGPWVRTGDDCQCCDQLHAKNGVMVAAGVDVINAEYIASWHPVVALAVADLLDMAATHQVGFTPVARERIVTVASAYLGSES